MTKFNHLFKNGLLTLSTVSQSELMDYLSSRLTQEQINKLSNTQIENIIDSVSYQITDNIEEFFNSAIDTTILGLIKNE